MIGEAQQSGPTVCVIGGIHGDERAGIEIVRSLPNYLRLERGRVIAILGNLQAIAAGQRPVDTNLNRAFVSVDSKHRIADPAPPSYESNRAQELMPYIDASKAILDLHEYEDPDGTPFIICERDSLGIAQSIGPAAIAFGFTRVEPGATDGYAHRRGIQALCYELGEQSGRHQDENVRLGRRAVHRFLAAMGLADTGLQPLNPKPLLVEADFKHIRTSEQHFEFARKFRSFEELTPGELIATDGDKEVRAPELDVPQVILFPKPKAPAVGREAFEIAKVVVA